MPSPVGYRRPCRMAVPFHRPQMGIRVHRIVLPIPGGMLSVPVESECMPHSGSPIAHGVWDSPPYKRETGPVVRTLQVKAWGTATWACPCMTRMGGLLPPFRVTVLLHRHVAGLSVHTPSELRGGPVARPFMSGVCFHVRRISVRLWPVFSQSLHALRILLAVTRSAPAMERTLECLPFSFLTRT